MPDCVQERIRYEPLTLVDTKAMPQREWLEWRRKGLGGSDVAAIMGISPFRTARDIYYDKVKVVSLDECEEECDDGWVAKELGHILEPLVAKIFQKKTGYEIYKVEKMFYHPMYPFMLADVDYFVKLPDGTTAILEIKTTDESRTGEWWENGKKIVPEYYETQGRHYMAVTDIDRVYYCCLYGRSEDDIIIRELSRDFDMENEMIFLEKIFWEENVMQKVPPLFTEKGDLVFKSANRHIGAPDTEAPEKALDNSFAPTLQKYMQLQEEKKYLNKCIKDMDDEIQRLKAILITEMDTTCKAVCNQEELKYEIIYNLSQRRMIDKDGLLKLELEYPEIYEQYSRISESRRFYVKVRAPKAA